MLKILFIGDIVGQPGRRILKALLKEIIDSEKIDFVIANGENAAGGFGLTCEVCQELLNFGIDVITLGNHTWDNRDIYNVLERERRVVRPANYPSGTPGEGFYITETPQGVPIGVINLLGQVFLDPLSCPFRTADEYLDHIHKKAKIVIVDIHAEATSEKMALGWYLDGRVTAVIGTHTHIPTADERILPKGTGYITDVGMTGPIDSVLGINPELVIKRFLTKRPVRFEVASGPIQLNGVILEVTETGYYSFKIKRISRKYEVTLTFFGCLMLRLFRPSYVRFYEWLSFGYLLLRLFGTVTYLHYLILISKIISLGWFVQYCCYKIKNRKVIRFGGEIVNGSVKSIFKIKSQCSSRGIGGDHPGKREC